MLLDAVLVARNSRWDRKEVEDDDTAAVNIAAGKQKQGFLAIASRTESARKAKAVDGKTNMMMMRIISSAFLSGALLRLLS